MNGLHDEPLFNADDRSLELTPIRHHRREAHVVEELKRLASAPARSVSRVARDCAPETLVMALRAAFRRGLEDVACDIAEVLSMRIARHVRRKTSALPWRDSEERDDVEDELAVILWQCWTSLDESDEFWEIRFWNCLDRRLYDVLRRNRGRKRDIEVPVHGDLGGEHGLSTDDWVHVAMDALPREQRLAIIMKFFEGWTEQEIAAKLRVSERTVRNYIHRGLERLRAIGMEAEP